MIRFNTSQLQPSRLPSPWLVSTAWQPADRIAHMPCTTLEWMIYGRTHGVAWMP